MTNNWVGLGRWNLQKLVLEMSKEFSGRDREKRLDFKSL